MNTENQVRGWLIRNCPNFFYMPSVLSDTIFVVWDTADWNCPAYWSLRGLTAIPLVECEDVEATHWIVNNSYGIFDRETRDACVYLGKSIVSVKISPNEEAKNG